MPIRLNLLAEQQAAEEERRRDPVKRSLFAGIALIALLLLWSGWIQFQVSQAKGEVRARQAHWDSIEPAYLQVSNHIRNLGTARQTLSSLEKYSTNRFLWANALNALQYCTDPQVRVVSLVGQCAMTNNPYALEEKSLFVNLPPRGWWQFWSAPFETNVWQAAQAQLAAMTNKPSLAPFLDLIQTHTTIVTNPIQIVTRIEVIKPETVTETITLSLKGRDYSNPPARRYEAFYSNLIASPYFGNYLEGSRGSVQPDTVRLSSDPGDLTDPDALFISFKLDWTFPDRIRANE